MVGDILDAIEAEIERTDEYLDFKVIRSEQEGNYWKVFVDLSHANAKGLDESLEGAAAWWGGPPKGTADVLSVIPEHEQINLRFATTPPPQAGRMIRIYPPQYLEALLKCWENIIWSAHCMDWLSLVANDNDAKQPIQLSTNSFTWLRRKQKEAFALLKYKSCFLWGPPGTGKTTTLGALLAEYLRGYPKHRVLLLSTTNSAVDQALIAADKSVCDLARQNRHPAQGRMFRVGNHFGAHYYVGREYLIPAQDTELIKEMAKLEAQRPDPEKVEDYAIWKAKVETLRQKIRQQAADVVERAQLVAMTTTRALFTFDSLLKLSPFDLIVFDEASQVGIAHALALAPLGKQCLFAGDPKQLAPIVKSDDERAKRWLGNSMFKYKKQDASTCMLTEQSRMAEPICRLVSNLFYDGQLQLANDCASKQTWHNERHLQSVPEIDNKHVCTVPIDRDGTWSHRYHGPIRYESAERILDLLGTLRRHTDDKDMLVLTPFRAQRALVKAMLKSRGYRVPVSTVHKSQGSERHTIIFDPVLGDNDFLKTDDAPRLVNVALSRAKARLVVTLSSGDLRNDLFNRLANVINNAEQHHNVESISKFIGWADFPACLKGKTVQIADAAGTVTDIQDNGEAIVVNDFNTGRLRKFKTQFIVNKHRA
jgi:hypothetical protein